MRHISQPKQYLLGYSFSARAVLFEFGFNSTFRNALFEFTLEILELKVAALESFGDCPHMRRLASRLFYSRLRQNDTSHAINWA